MQTTKQKTQYELFRERMFISDNMSITEIPRFEHGVWQHETGRCDCPTCKTLGVTVYA
jgi:hypothetical protein